MNALVRPVVDKAEQEDALALRIAVFVDEQGVPASEEVDEYDADAVHLVALDDGGAVIGTCRILRGDAADATARIGRIAVTAAHRGTGVGAALLETAGRVAAEAGAGRLELSAQLAARGFYERAGYTATGPVYLDAGIEHVLMSRPA